MTGQPDRPFSGWCIERVPGKPLDHTEDGRLAIPLRLSKDGVHAVDAALILTAAQAEQLHAALCYRLGPVPPPKGKVPSCRKSPWAF